MNVSILQGKTVCSLKLEPGHQHVDSQCEQPAHTPERHRLYTGDRRTAQDFFRLHYNNHTFLWICDSFIAGEICPCIGRKLPIGSERSDSKFYIFHLSDLCSPFYAAAAAVFLLSTLIFYSIPCPKNRTLPLCAEKFYKSKVQ